MDNIFCPLPFTELDIATTGAVKVCCAQSSRNKIGQISETKINDIWNGDALKEIRHAFLTNQKHPACHDCWEDENNGFPSKRHGINKFHEESKQRGQLISYDIHNPKAPISLVLNMSNNCNLACRTCDSALSSGWEKEELFFADDVIRDTLESKINLINNSWNEKNQIWEALDKWLPSLKFISLVGGEPMLVKNMWKLLQKSIDLGYAKNQTIQRINTNCTIYKDEYIKILNQFKYSELHLSIDGIDKVFEYTRYPTKWSRVLKNIKKYLNKDYQGESLLTCTVSIFNIFYIKEVSDLWLMYVKNRRFGEINLNLVRNFSYFCITNLPTYVKEIITEKYKELNHFQISGMIKFMNSREQDKKEWNNFIKVVKQHDQYRGQKFKDYMPEFAEILNWKQYE
jgi:MoaA/NifB/PqqE/SkfB family radical SAM enzyme